MAHWNPRSFFRVNGGLTSLLTRASGCGSWCLSLWSQVWAWLGSQRNWRRSSQRTWLLPWQTWLHRALVTVYITNLRNFLNKNDCYFMWTSPILNKFLLSKPMQGHMRRLSEKQLSQAGPVQSAPPPSSLCICFAWPASNRPHRQCSHILQGFTEKSSSLATLFKCSYFH